MPEAPSTRNNAVGDIDRVVHEPARLKVLSQLYVVESADFLFLIQQTGLTQGNLSSHLSKLEAAGYIGMQKEFVDKRPRTVLRLTPEGRAAFDDYVAHLRRLLDDVSSARQPSVSVAGAAATTILVPRT